MRKSIGKKITAWITLLGVFMILICVLDLGGIKQDKSVQSRDCTECGNDKNRRERW